MKSLSELRRARLSASWVFAVPVFAVAGSAGCTSTIVASSDAGSDAATVDTGVCHCSGPAPGTPNVQCSDGTIGGPVCAPHTDGTCAWEIRSCPCPALGCNPSCPNGVLKDSHGCGTCQCAPDPDGGDGGAPCASDADCAGGVCGFPQADGCSAAGSCFPGPGFLCQAYAPGCACDGSEITLVCTGLPAGFARKPLRHAGACAEAGAPALTWYTTCGDPVCGAPGPDAGMHDAGTPCPAVGSSCSTKGQTCGTRDPQVNCGAIEICADRNPAVNCPISSRRFKDDIEYVDEARLKRLHDEALRIRLATYRYKPEVADPNPEHLGFIIEDDPGSPAVESARNRVDMYAYVSMAIAAMQVQEKEIAALRRELDEARAGACDPPRARVCSF